MNTAGRLALALMCGFGWAMAEEAKPAVPTYKNYVAVQVKLVEAAPEVDGKLDDAAWKDAPVLNLAYFDGSETKPKFATEARVVSTKDTVYFGVRCHETDMENLKAVQRDRDHEDMWRDDSVEVFIAPGEDASYFHFVVNAMGGLFDGQEKDTSFNAANAKAAAAKEEKAWTVELAIPFADLKLPEDKAPLAGGWRLNVNRTRQARGDDELEDYAWSPIGAGASSHTPSKFGYAFFEAFGGKLPPAEEKKAE